MLAHTMAVPGCQQHARGWRGLILLGPEHAATIAKDGFSKEDVKKFLFQEARLPLDFIPEANWDSFRRMRSHAEEFLKRGSAFPLWTDGRTFRWPLPEARGSTPSLFPLLGPRNP